MNVLLCCILIIFRNKARGLELMVNSALLNLSLNVSDLPQFQGTRFNPGLRSSIYLSVLMVPTHISSGFYGFLQYLKHTSGSFG